MIWIVLIVLAAVAGIIILSVHSPFHKKTREQIMASLAKFLESKAEPIAESPNSFRIKFVFEGREFIYEDIERPSFREKIYKAYLKSPLKQDFTMNFSEKEKEGIIRSETFTRATLSRNIEHSQIGDKLNIPKELSSFSIYTNNVKLANKLFENKKSLNIFCGLVNFDHRGTHSMPLKFIDGNLILEFDSTENKKPNIKALHRDCFSIEGYLVYLTKILEVIDNG